MRQDSWAIFSLCVFILGLNVAVLVDLIGRRLCNWLSFRFMIYPVERFYLGFPVRKYGNAVPLWHGMRMPWYMGLLFVISLHWKCSIAAPTVESRLVNI